MAERIRSSPPTDVRVGESYVLRARARHYDWEGTQPLSIKAFFGGEALYSAGGGYHAVGGAGYLILNADQRYAIHIETPRPVESFCVFFAPTLTADVGHSLTRDDAQLLDDPVCVEANSTFYERVYPADEHVWPALLRLRAGMRGMRGMREPGGDELTWNEERLRELMAALWLAQRAVRTEVDGLAAARPATRDEVYRRVYLARDYAAAMYATPVTLEDLASVAGMSPNHLLRTFGAVFHQTPHQYLTALRLERAAALLRETSLSVTEVCRTVGYASLGSFSALFKRHLGASPQEYGHAIR